MYHVVTAKGAIHVLYGASQSEFTSIEDAVRDGSVFRALAKTVVVILDYGVQNQRPRAMTFNQYNMDSIEVTLEEW